MKHVVLVDRYVSLCLRTEKPQDSKLNFILDFIYILILEVDFRNKLFAQQPFFLEIELNFPASKDGFSVFVCALYDRVELLVGLPLYQRVHFT